MDHDELPRISITSMHVWLRIKAEFTREVQAKVNVYAKQQNLPARRKEELLKDAQEVLVSYETRVYAHLFCSTWTKRSRYPSPTFA